MGKSLYDRISEDNIRKYGTEYEKVLRIIINQYSDRTHFIYEILQNAEDAGATHIKFQLEKNQLVIFHNGRPFDEKDIEGVCGIASGTKEDGTRIGHFGIGFKSVYCYTDRPQIYSAEHHFAIRNRLFPEEISPRAGLAASETCMILPFDRDDVTPETAYQEIRNALIKKITAESILMLNRIADVEIRIAGYQDVIAISKEKYPLDKANPDNVFALSVQTTHTNQANGKKSFHDEDYLFFTDAEKEATAVIFREEEKELKPIKNSKIYAFFPTAKEAHQNFYIHAPFDTTPARDNFKEGAEYGKHNIKLVRNIGNLICFAFCWMRDHHYLSVAGFRNVFPVYEYEEDDVLYPLYENSIDMIREEAILPTSNPGEFKNLKDICVPLWSVIVDSFDTDDLRRLMRRRNLNWIAKEFTTEAYRDLLAFLKANFTLETLDWKDLVMRLDATFLQEKSLTWMERLMSRIESYCIRRSSGDSHYINASQIPFVRTTDRKQICARDEGGRLQVYLNNPDIALYKIESSFLKSESIRSFYERALQIPEYDVQQEAVENILPKYAGKNPAFKTNSPISENIEDLKTIKDAIYVNPAVAEKVADCYVVTDGKDWYRPSELYISSGDIRTGYSLVKGILPIHFLSGSYFDGSPRTLKLDEDFFRRLIEPLARLDVLLPVAALLRAGIGGHVNGCARQWQTALTTSQAVADFAAATRGRAVERLNRGREVVRFGFQRNHCLDGFDLESRGLVRLGGSELLHLGTEDERHVVLVCRHEAVRVHLRGLLDEGKQRVGHPLAVDDEGAVENLVAAVFGVHLRKAIHLTVSQFAPNLCGYAFQIVHLLFAESQTFLLVVCLNVVDVFQGFWLAVDGKHGLVEVLVAVLQHRVKRRVLRLHFLELLDAHNALDAHILGNFDGIGAPRRNHLSARPDEVAFHRVFLD